VLEQEKKQVSFQRQQFATEAMHQFFLIMISEK